MHKKRRDFLQQAGLLAAGSLVLPQWGCTDSPKENTAGAAEAAAKAVTEAGPSLKNFGLQLYTLRDVFPQDPKGVLKELASYGFTQVESYEKEQGIFWDMGNKGFKQYLDDLGMKAVSSHCDIYNDFEKKAAEAAEIEMDYLICPWVGPQKSMDDWKKVTDKFNECGEICRKNGINFAYHNHAYSFQPFTGLIPHDFIMDNTDPDLVHHEMDIYWVVTGGADPIDFMKKYSGRFRLCHIKDRMADSEERMASCNLGTGIIDYPKILKAASENGMKYFLFEQERYDGTTPMECAKVGADYLKKLQFA